MPVLRLFASAREAAGDASVEIDAATVDELLAEAVRRYGSGFADVLATSRVWVNGQPADGAARLTGRDVVAVLPPVSGGSARTAQRPAPARPAASRSAPPAPAAPRPAPSRPPAFQPPTARQAPRPNPPSPPPTFSHPSPAVPDALARQPELFPDASSATDEAVEPVPRTAAPSATATATPSRSPSRSTEARPALEVVPRAARPHGRLGLAWALGTVVVTVAGSGWLAIWLAATAAAAASQTAMVWRGRRERPLPGFAAAAAAALPLAAASGAPAINAVMAASLLAMLLARMAARTRAPARDVALTLLIAVPVGLAAVAPVLLREIGIQPALFLFGCAAAYDAGAYLVGTGASSSWEGPAAGIAALVPVTFVGAVLLPESVGQAAFLLGALAAVLAPLGPLAASALLGSADAPAPAMRRLDSLLVLGPLWGACFTALVH